MNRKKTFLIVFLLMSIFSVSRASENFYSHCEALLPSNGPESEKDTLIFSIPNAFKPNDRDPRVTSFKPGSPEPDKFAEYKIQIYNTWGMLLFESTDPSTGWDGKHKGTLCPIDTYVYILNYAFWAEDETGQLKAGELIKTKGNITLLD